MTLCRKAHAAYQKSFRLTLVDVVRGNRAIANAFYRNPNVFGNVLFRRGEHVRVGRQIPTTRQCISMLHYCCKRATSLVVSQSRK